MKYLIYCSLFLIPFYGLGQKFERDFKKANKRFELYAGLGAGNAQVYFFEDQNSNTNIYKSTAPSFFPKVHIGVSLRILRNSKFNYGIGIRYQNKGGRNTVSGLSGPSISSYDFNNYLLALLDSEYNIVNRINIYNGITYGWNFSERLGAIDYFSWSLLTGLNFDLSRRSKIGIYYNQDISLLNSHIRNLRFYSFDLSYYFKI